MSDWTCRVSASISRPLCSAQLLLVLADGMSTLEVQTRALEIARDHYGPDACIDEVCPEDWAQVRPWFIAPAGVLRFCSFPFARGRVG